MMNDECKGEDLKRRTKMFALRVIRLCSTLARSGPADVIGRQLVRCGTSVGAQYREACRARSVAEFISKIESAAQELDETIYWMELLAEAQLVRSEKLASLQSEANELMAIFVASVRTAKQNKGR
jgi:four helix bundle protein